MGRRRRRVIRIVKKKLPTVFICPRCGEEAVRVTIAKDTGKATVMCALCQLKDEFQAHPAAQMIDVYSYFADRFYGVKDPRAIMPREREPRTHAAEEEPSKPELAKGPEETTPGQPSPLPNEDRPVDRPELSPESQLEGPTPTEAEPAPLSPGEASPEAAPTPPGESPEASSEEKPPAEDEEPFADILGSKDKKRYSPNPVPQQESDQTSQSSD